MLTLQPQNLKSTGKDRYIYRE